MHLSLSDLLSCPACGPDHGLILLPGSVAERRVQEGVLGCGGCRRRYPIRGGVADLRAAALEESPEGAAAAASPGGPAEAEAVRLGGLLGLAGVTGAVLLLGHAVGVGMALGGLVAGVEVIVGGEACGEVAGMVAVTRVRVSGALPFRSGSVSGVAVTGDPGRWLEESARVVRPAGRVLVEPADEGMRARAESAGLRIVLAEGGLLVGSRRP